VFSARGDVPESKMPNEINPPGILFWRRPTLARPVAVLPSGLQRFTAVFGMGTGGATALLSPEVRAGLAFRCTAATQARGGISDDNVDRTVSKELPVL
jgi:hypothetical protein